MPDPWKPHGDLHFEDYSYPTLFERRIKSIGELRHDHGELPKPYVWCDKVCPCWLSTCTYTFTCGCGQVHNRFYRDVVVHDENGQHWRLSCLLGFLIEGKL